MNPAILARLMALLKGARAGAPGAKWADFTRKAAGVRDRVSPSQIKRFKELRKKAGVDPDFASTLKPADKELLDRGVPSIPERMGRAFAEGGARRRGAMSKDGPDKLIEGNPYGFFKQPFEEAAYTAGRRPVLTALGALPLIAGAGGAAKGFVGGVAEDTGIADLLGSTVSERFLPDYEQVAGRRAAAAGIQAQSQLSSQSRRTERIMAENLARLAQVDPQAYREFAAGRQLPQGARVFGGQPRTDILEEIAMGIQNGRYLGP